MNNKILTNGTMVKIFEKRELVEIFKLSQIDVQKFIYFQDRFPELLQNTKMKGFLVEGRKLWEQLGKPYTKFADWMKKRVLKQHWKEKVDYITMSQKIDLANKGYKNITNYKFTIEMAKHVALLEKTTQGRLVRDCFILMEDVMYNYQEWANIRGVEAKGYIELKNMLSDKFLDEHEKCWSTPGFIYSNEANMMNRALLNKSSKDIKIILELDEKDSIRNHFTIEINDMLNQLQILDMTLLANEMDYKTRKQFIINTCKIRFVNAKKELDEIIERYNKSNGKELSNAC